MGCRRGADSIDFHRNDVGIGWSWDGSGGGIRKWRLGGFFTRFFLLLDLALVYVGINLDYDVLPPM